MKAGKSGGPLEGCRVLELTTTVAGPFCGRLLADFGAEVIKVEPPAGDIVRTMGKRKDGKSLYAASILRNKALISLDLRRPEGQQAARRLANRCDIVIENFRPGRMAEWGLDHATLSEDNQRLVMVSISGYGQDGPYRERPGYGVIMEAVGGLRHLTGDPESPPSRMAVSLTDYITGIYGALGAVMALQHARATGRGQVVDAALYEGAFSIMEQHVPAFAALGTIPKRTGSRLGNNVPNNLYYTGDGQMLLIAAPAQGNFRRLTECMGRPELVDDPRFAYPEARNENEDALDALISEWTGAHTLAELEEQLHAVAIPASPILTIEDIFTHPQYQAREMLVDLPEPDFGKVTLPAVIPKLSVTPGAIRWAGRYVGENTREVLQSMAGYTDDEWDALQACGAAYQRDGLPTGGQSNREKRA